MNLLPDIVMERHDELLVVSSLRPLQCLSSAIVGGGLTETHHILVRHVDKSYDHRDAASEYRAFVRNLGMPHLFVGLMTAVWLRQAAVVQLCEQGLACAAIVTAGVRNATTAGKSLPFAQSTEPGTINVVLLIDARLTSSAMVNAVITATEAKADVLREWGIVTEEGFQATGTSTDAIVVACATNHAPIEYAGPATSAGYLIGRCVRQGLAEALNAYSS